MPLPKWLSGFPRAALIGALAFSGCSSERLGGQGRQTPQEKGDAATQPVHKEVGEASWYGPGFQGRETANGETFDQKGMTAAHPSLPMGTKAEVTNLENGKKVEVTINDRVPMCDSVQTAPNVAVNLLITLSAVIASLIIRVITQE